MKALKASICIATIALALSLSPGAPSRAGENEAGTLSRQIKDLYRAGKYLEALPLAQKSLALREKKFGPDDAKVATPLNDLGMIHYNLGQYAVAEPLYKRSLAITEKTPGQDDLDVADVLNNLGDLYRAEGRYAEAEPFLKRSIALSEKGAVATIRRW
ncbi:tetratricopeptide repeat protein [Rhodopseudomonas sp. P2A-2r]|uniref:tetratricopeptide repeat protein n=1 Tax=unclassified Rhodopseudomonas TaxID=2638247 RepID=UPI0022342D42|nr:tetratricopeptide repeat protein [Rhodopseudomonas sp. P2A-2r]UZE47311.1 tetratricopeptide repeat protein [Rhodopseudomonas sp. P2A-2r]